MGNCIKINLRCVAAALMTLALTVMQCVATAPAMAEEIPYNLRIGFSRTAFVSVPKDDIKIAVQLLSQKLARKSQVMAESRVYESTIDIERELKSKKVDLVILGSDEFIRIRGHAHLEPVMTTVARSSHEVELLLLARKESGLNSFTDLKNKSIALPSLYSQFGVMYLTWLETLIFKAGAASIGNYFSSVNETRNASQAIMPVFFRKSDVCVVSRQAFEIASELNPQIARDMKTIAHINRLAGGIIAFRQDLPDVLKQKVIKALTTLHEDQEGRQMFMLFQMSKLTPFRPDHLKGTEALYTEHGKLKAKMALK